MQTRTRESIPRRIIKIILMLLNKKKHTVLRMEKVKVL